jgi:hypothetical protein
LVRVGPSLFESDPGKKLLALTIIDDAELPKQLVDSVLIIAADALKDPRVAKKSREILYKYLSKEQLLEIAGSDTDPEISAAASEVVAQQSLEKVQEIATQNENQSIRGAAQRLLDRTSYIVYIRSTTDKEDADRAVKKANATFLVKHVELTAEVIPPEENYTSYWGIYVGKQLGIGEAQSRLRKAKDAGYKDAFIARLGSS